MIFIIIIWLTVPQIAGLSFYIYFNITGLRPLSDNKANKQTQGNKTWIWAVEEKFVLFSFHVLQ
jgi:hypothetical protein